MEKSMNITYLVSFLSPFLPVLLKLGQKTLDKGSDELAKKGAEEIWTRLFPKVEKKPGAMEAAEDVAKNPEDEDAVAALRYQLKKILEDPENTDLVAEISKILEDTKKESSEKGKFEVNAPGSNIGVIGDNAQGNINFGTKS